jgi:hypothetical protein
MDPPFEAASAWVFFCLSACALAFGTKPDSLTIAQTRSRTAPLAKLPSGEFIMRETVDGWTPACAAMSLRVIGLASLDFSAKSNADDTDHTTQAPSPQRKRRKSIAQLGVYRAGGVKIQCIYTKVS